MTPGNAVRADPVEEREASLYRIVHVKHGGILKPESVSTKQERIAELARNNPAMALTTLAHHIDYEWVKYAYDCTRKDGAVGVDGLDCDNQHVRPCCLTGECYPRNCC